MAESSPIEQAELLAQEKAVQAAIGDRPLDFLSLNAVSNIYRAAAAVRRRAERDLLSDYGITWGGFTILWVLWVWGEMEAAPLAAECNLAKGTLTGMLTTLEKQELVRRTQHPGDKRRVLVALTEVGHDCIEELYPRFNRQETAFTAGLDDDEKVDLARLLRRVITNAELSES